MSKRLQVVMTETEYQEIQDAAERRRTTVSEWVRQVLRDGRHDLPSPEPASGASFVREASRGYEGKEEERGSPGPSVAPVPVSEALIAEVMDRYRFPTREAAVHFALRRAANPPMAREELLAMQGSGWAGDLQRMRENEDPAETP
jgi:Arc/MetJ family transcription regulator